MRVSRPEGECGVCGEEPCLVDCPAQEMYRRRELQGKALAKFDRNELKKWGVLGEVDSEVLLPWMRRYAEYLAGQVRKPGKTERGLWLRAFLKWNLPEIGIRYVEARPDFEGYLKSLKEDDLAPARAKLKAGMSDVVGYHLEAARRLHEAGDTKELHRYTRPILEAVVPKEKTASVTATQVIVNLGGKGGFAEKYLGEETVIEEGNVEVVRLD